MPVDGQSPSATIRWGVCKKSCYSFEQPFGCLIGVELCAEKLQCDNLEFSFCVLLYSYVDKVGLLG